MANYLMYATQQGDLETVLDIINNQPWLLLERERSLKTALHYSAENQDTSCCQALIMAAPELVNSPDQDGYTPLHLAVIASNHSLIHQLLDHGADVNATDNDRHTPLHWATVCNDAESVQVLLERGGDANLGDIHGGRPLHYAVQMCGDAQVAVTTQPGSDIDDRKRSLSVLQLLILHGAEVNVPDSHGRQPIIWAASAGSPEAILALVNAGSSVEASDHDGLTALHCAASRGHMDCINTLINFCSAEVDVIDTNGCSALFYAVTLGHLESVVLLLKFGSNPNRQDRKGRTAAHCGAAKGQLEAVKTLDRWGADLWQRSVRGNYPLHEAVTSGRSDLLAWLLSQRPQAVNASNNDGQTLLHIAAARDHIHLCQMLINAGALLNPVMKRRSGDLVTPIDVAITKSNNHLAKVLQSMGGVPISRLTIQSAALTRPSTRALTGTGYSKPKAIGDKHGEPIIKMRPARDNEKRKIKEENKDFTEEANDEQILQVFVGEDIEIRRVKNRLRNKKRVLKRSMARKSKKCKREKIHFSKLKSKFTTRYADGYEISTSSAEINSETDYATESDNSYSKANRVKKVGFKFDANMRNESTECEKLSSNHEQSDNQIDLEEIGDDKSCTKTKELSSVDVPEDSEWIVHEQEKSEEPMAQENSSNDTEKDNVQIVEAMVHHQASLNIDSSFSSKGDDAVKSCGEVETDREQGSMEQEQSYHSESSPKQEESNLISEAGYSQEVETTEANSDEEKVESDENVLDTDQNNYMNSEDKVESEVINEEAGESEILGTDKEVDLEEESLETGIEEEKSHDGEDDVVKDEDKQEETKAQSEEAALEVTEEEGQDEIKDEVEAEGEGEAEDVEDGEDQEEVEGKDESVGQEDREDQEEVEGKDESIGQEDGENQEEVEGKDKSAGQENGEDQEKVEGEDESVVQEEGEDQEDVEGKDESVGQEEGDDLEVVESKDEAEVQEEGDDQEEVEFQEEEETEVLEEEIGVTESQTEMEDQIEEQCEAHEQEEEVVNEESGTTFEEDLSRRTTEENESLMEEMDVQQEDKTCSQQEEELYYEDINQSAEDKSLSQKSIRELNSSLPTKDEERMDLGEEVTLADEISASEQEATESCRTHEVTKNSRHNNTLSNSVILPLEEETASLEPDGTKRSSLLKCQSREDSQEKETNESGKDEMSRRTSKLTGDSLEYTLEQGLEGSESHELSKTEIKSTHRGMSIIFKRTYPYGTGCRQFLDNVQKYKYFHMRNTTKSMSLTQSFQTGMKKFHMERKILSKLIELKHLQMNSKQENEMSFVKRLINSYHKDGLLLGIYPYKGVTSFRGFEKYLYEQLWLLQRSGKEKRRKEDWGEVDLRDNHCIKITHRCSHTNQTYTELPTAAYKMNVKDNKGVKTSADENGLWERDGFSVEVSEAPSGQALTTGSSHHLLTLTLTNSTQAKKR